MRVGIVGYSGSGKSTVFSALAPGAPADRGGVTYGAIKVPDRRVDQLAEMFHPKKTTYAEITFVDVGGGGTGAKGAFPPAVVQHMRNADVLVHVVRVFENPMLSEPADPKRDVQAFNDELLLLDLAVMEKRVERMKKENKKGLELEVSEKCLAHLEGGEPLRSLDLADTEIEALTAVQLLSMTPLLTLYNLSEEAWEDAQYAGLKTIQGPENDEISMGICASIEAEIAQLPPEEQKDFLEGLGLGEPARNVFVRAAFSLLDLISMLTAGPDECRAWPIRRGLTAKKAAGKIHSDIERGFIRAEIFPLEELLAAGSEAELKKQGKVRVEGKEYVMQDGDVVNFRFNV